MKSAEELLTQWGIWVWQKTGVPRYVSPMLAIMRDNVPSTHAPDAAITDEEAETVSAVVARLQQRYPEASEAVHLYYCHNRTMEQIGKHLRKSRHQVKDMLSRVHGYVESEFDRRMAA